MTQPSAGGIDSTTPNVARIYDYLLGGKDNFAADRMAAEQLIASIPDIAAIARDNRAFLIRVVRYLTAEAGIRQFLDLGGGLPTGSNVHQVAQAIAPDARVVYVDYDPVVWSHGQALLTHADGTEIVLGNLTKPADVLGAPEVIRLLDLTKPVAVLCTATLHFVSDSDQPHTAIAEYRDRLAPGSYLAISHGSVEDEDPWDDNRKAASVYSQASAQLHARTIPEIRRFFDGFEIVEPGLVWMTEWRPDPGVPPTGRVNSLRGCVGRKPLSPLASQHRAACNFHGCNVVVISLGSCRLRWRRARSTGNGRQTTQPNPLTRELLALTITTLLTMITDPVTQRIVSVNIIGRLELAPTATSDKRQRDKR